MSAQTEEWYSAGSLAGLSTPSKTKPKANESNATYRIVFWGQSIGGLDITNVKRDLAKRFKINNQRQLDQLFSGKVFTLKKGLNEAQANNYINAMLAVGALARKESEFKDYFFETEVKQRNRVTFLEDDFDPESLTLAPKDEFSAEH